MQCPFCEATEDRVIDSRENKEATAIRRRRQCLSCGRRFTSYERIDEIPYMVVKKGGQRESFRRSKILSGILKACEKRPVSPQQMEEIVDLVEKELMELPDREITSIRIGEVVMDHLKGIDKVAYIRFASVYLDFKTIDEFIDEINQIVHRN